MVYTIARQCLTGALVCMTAVGIYAQDAAPKARAADNTAVNKRDRDKAAVTADQAKETKPDREIMQEIRQAVMADKSLSTYAHNVKIVATHGKVTLKGPVHTEEEKKSIEAKAAEIAGAANVTNQISIKPEKAK